MKKTEFRVWIKDEEKMVYSKAGENFISLDGSYYKIIYNLANHKKMILSKEDDDNIELMQYIGKEDKNKKKIFKDDIVIVTCLKKAPYNEKAIITFHSNAWCIDMSMWYPKCKEGWITIIDQEMKFEVIGNKFENLIEVLIDREEKNK